MKKILTSAAMLCFAMLVTAQSEKENTAKQANTRNDSTIVIHKPNEVHIMSKNGGGVVAAPLGLNAGIPVISRVGDSRISMQGSAFSRPPAIRGTGRARQAC